VEKKIIHGAFKQLTLSTSVLTRNRRSDTKQDEKTKLKVVPKGNEKIMRAIINMIDFKSDCYYEYIEENHKGYW
jgi:hypothetical protein